MNRTDFQRLAMEFLRDAKALLAARRWARAYYVSGYVVECGLKAAIAKLTKEGDFPDKGFAEKCWTHELRRLISLAGLRDAWEGDLASDVELDENWSVVTEWNESSRYARKTKRQAERLYAAITDKTHGVLSWIKLRW